MQPKKPLELIRLPNNPIPKSCRHTQYILCGLAFCLRRWLRCATVRWCGCASVCSMRCAVHKMQSACIAPTASSAICGNPSGKSKSVCTDNIQISTISSSCCRGLPRIACCNLLTNCQHNSLADICPGDSAHNYSAIYLMAHGNYMFIYRARKKESPTQEKSPQGHFH